MVLMLYDGDGAETRTLYAHRIQVHAEVDRCNDLGYTVVYAAINNPLPALVRSSGGFAGIVSWFQQTDAQPVRKGPACANGSHTATRARECAFGRARAIFHFRSPIRLLTTAFSGTERRHTHARSER
jgi:hypothetical protein